MSKAQVSKTSPEVFNLIALVTLLVTSFDGYVSRKITAWIPIELLLLDNMRAEVDAGSKRAWMLSPVKAKALYDALTVFEGEAVYGSGAWLATKSARRAMNAMHAYKVKAGASAQYELRVVSKLVTS
jgi:hypothetical protein